MVVPPGRYASLFLWSNKLFVTAFKQGDHNCSVFIRPDGNELPMKRGFCADSDDPLSAFGYALVRDSRRRYGSIDAKGRRLISPRYKSLSALNAKFLVFDDDRKQPTVHGVVRANGKLLFRISSARIQTIGAGASPAVLRDLFVARSPDGAGLIDVKGIWRVPPIYHDVTVLSADLIALEQQAGEHRFVDGNGNFLPLTGRYFGLRDPVSGAFWLEQCSAEQKADVHNLSCPRGLVNRFGQIIVAARFDAIENAGNGLWHVGIYRRAQMLWGVYDSDGVERIAPAFAELDKEAGRARTVATTASYRQVLIDAHGNILARAVEQ